MSTYTLIGSEMSPYSIKVRSYCRYKNIPHKWRVAAPQRDKQFKRFAKLPIVPLLITPDEQGLQDSTPIMERLENEFTEPPAVPEQPALAFVSRLLEDYADEWGNKHMFHLRWKEEEERNSAARRLAKNYMPLAMRYLPVVNVVMEDRIATLIKKRMVGRRWVVGSNDNNAPIIEASYHRLLSLLEAHLETRSYMFGARPSFADFGLWGNIFTSRTDPGPGRMIRAEYPGLEPWLERMLSPSDEGNYEAWRTLQATLLPILQEEVAACYLPWASAVAEALREQREEMEVTLPDGRYTQKIGGPQKYHAKSLAVLRELYAQHRGDEELEDILQAGGCRSFF